MMRRFFVAVAVLAACASRPRSPEEKLKGDIPIAITNMTSQPVWGMNFDGTFNGRFRTVTMLFDGIYGRPGPMAPNETRQYSFIPGSYTISMGHDHHVTAFREGNIVIDKPTQIVVYDGAPPNVTPQAGMTLLLKESEQSKNARANQAAKNRIDQSRAECERFLGNPAVAPGKIKATGKWKCVLGGAFTGTDYVDLVQLADGKISATVSGADRDMTWSGVVNGDTVSFRFAGQAASGGVLKLDASGRAMIGNCHTFTARGECVAWTLTCTR